MDKEQSLALYEQGKTAWNKWANKKLAEKEQLEEEGAWEAEKDKWEDDATATFFNHTFRETTDFLGFIFPGLANFTKAQSLKNARFDGAKFHGRALFIKAKFSDISFFYNTNFLCPAKFNFASFFKMVWFDKALFSSDAIFNNAAFYEKSSFHDIIFNGPVLFGNAKFISDPDKLGATAHIANFSAINCKSYFNLEGARFEQVPDFSQAHFLETPSLDNIIIGPKARENPTPPANQSPSPLRGVSATQRGNSLQWSELSNERPEPGEGPADKGGGKEAILRQAQDEVRVEAKDIPSRWRHLRRLATQGHDHENEQNFFAEEIKSRRGVYDNPFGEKWQRWWVGWLYQLFSDFGRSIWRPLWIWAISTLLFAASYLPQNSILKAGGTGYAKLECFSSSANPLWSALNLSVSRSLVLGSQLAKDSVSRSLQCLYGTDGRPFEIGRPMVHLPDWIVFSGYAQPLFSATMIFLILLAIRNQFRIR